MGREYLTVTNYAEKNKGVKIIWFYVPIFAFPHKTTNHPYDYLTLNKRDGSGMGMRYKVLDEHGKQFKIKDPFEKSEYEYEYIY